MNLHHVSLPTGRSHLCRREDAEHLLASAEDLLAAAMAQGTAQVPAQDLELQAVARQGCLLCMIWRGHYHLATLAVASASTDGSSLWQSMLETSPIALDAKKSIQPPVPWCATRIEAAGLTDIDLHACLETCAPSLGWAWLRMVSVVD